MAINNYIEYYKKAAEELEQHEHKVAICRKEVVSAFVAISSICLFKSIERVAAECHHTKWTSEELGVTLFQPCEPGECPLLKSEPVTRPGTTFSLDDVNNAA